MSATTETSPAPVGYLALLRVNANFRNLWFGQIISLLGDWFNLIASAALIAMLTQSGLAVGGLFVVRMLAQFVGSLIGGVLADRTNRKHLLILTDVVRAVTVLGFLLVRTPEQVWMLYALTSIQLFFAGIFVPTRDAILPDVVSGAELGAANALGAATWSTMLALGAALGGIVAGEWGLQPAFVIDSLTFVASTFFISHLRYQPTNPGEGKAASPLSFISQYAEGLRYIKQHHHILVLTLQKASMALGVTSAFQIIQVTLASQEFVMGEGGSTSLGIFYAVVGVGTGLGPILARRITGDDEMNLRQAIVVSYGIAIVGLLTVSTLANFGVVLFGSLLRGLGVAVAWVFSTQLLQRLLPNRVRGRVFSTDFALVMVTNAAGAALAGWAFDNTHISISQMLWLMSGITLVMGLVLVAAGLLRPALADSSDSHLEEEH